MKDTPYVNQVRDFYDEFMRSRMVEYRIHGNARIDAAINRVIPLLSPAYRILDVGCGIGMVAQKLARHVPKGFVLGVDLSPKNIWYAEQTAKASNLSFAVLDVVSELPSALERMGGPADLVLLVDVIEHIPESNRQGFIQQLRTLSSEHSWLVMTYPSPQYQRYLMSNNPSELQVVDNVIELDWIVDEATKAGYYLRHYSLEDVWMSNQYCHIVFQTDNSLASLCRNDSRPALTHRVLRRIRSEIKRRVVIPIRRRKYITSVFGD